MKDSFLNEYRSRRTDRLIGIEVLDATQHYSLSDIFNLQTENLVLDQSLLQRNNRLIPTALIADDAGRRLA